MKKILFVMSAFCFLSTGPAMAAPSHSLAAVATNVCTASHCSDNHCGDDHCGDAVVWGGEGIKLTVDEKKATLEFDCARGDISNWVTKHGVTAGLGSYTQLSGARPQNPPQAVPAAYLAKIVERSRMKLTVILSDGTPAEYKLVKGARADLHYCE